MTRLPTGWISARWLKHHKLRITERKNETIIQKLIHCKHSREVVRSRERIWCYMQEAHRTKHPWPERNPPRHIIIKMPEIQREERILVRTFKWNKSNTRVNGALFLLCGKTKVYMTKMCTRYCDTFIVHMETGTRRGERERERERGRRGGLETKLVNRVGERGSKPCHVQVPILCDECDRCVCTKSNEAARSWAWWRTPAISALCVRGSLSLGPARATQGDPVSKRGESLSNP